jgi:hypothetical protein
MALKSRTSPYIFFSVIIALCSGVIIQLVFFHLTSLLIEEVNIEPKEVKVTGFDADGITLISPTDTAFDSKIDVLAAPGWADLLKEARPWLVIVSNNTQSKVVAFTTLFVLTRSNGETMHFYSLHKAPDAVVPAGVDFGDRSDRGIPPGGQRLVGINFAIPESEPKFRPSPGWDQERMWNWVISSTRDWIQNIKKQYAAGVKSIHIKLDAVIFEDGLLIGPDTDGQLGLTLAPL